MDQTSVVRRRCANLIASFVVGLGFVAGCKSAGTSGSGVDSGGDSSASGGLFADLTVPRCNQGPTSELHGVLDGQPVNYATGLASNLDPFSFQVLEVVDDAVRFDIVLTWGQPLAENQSIPLTGQSMIMREGQPFAKQSFCITAGEFGSPTLAATDPGRTLLFRITGARMGDCAGPEVPVSLAGCDFRTNTYFPVGNADAAVSDAASGDAALGDAADAGDKGLLQQCASPLTTDAGASCNLFDITGPWCNSEAFTPSDGGVAGNGGIVEGPAGGALVDGDYDLVRYRTTGTNRTRRTLRLLNGGTSIEWAADIDYTSGMTNIRYNTPTTRSGNFLNVATPTCITSAGTFMATSYGYTASGDDLLLFNFDTTGKVVNAYTYRRTCKR